MPFISWDIQMLIQLYVSIFELSMYASEQKLFVNGHIVLNKHSKTPGGNIGMFSAVSN